MRVNYGKALCLLLIFAALLSLLPAASLGAGAEDGVYLVEAEDGVQGGEYGEALSDGETFPDVPPASVFCTVSFLTPIGGPVPSQTVESGERAERPETPQAEGYLFLGWYIDAALTALFDFDAPVTADLCLFAGWGHAHEDALFLLWPWANSLPEAPGSYCLFQDVALATEWAAPQGETLLCLMGHTVTQGEDPAAAVVYVPEGAALSVYDCWESGAITGGRRIDGDGAGVYVSGVFYLHGASITGNITENAGGGVYIADGGILNFFSGSITGNIAGLGGGIYAADGATVALSNAAEIAGNADAALNPDDLFLAENAVQSILLLDEEEEYRASDGGSMGDLPIIVIEAPADLPGVVIETPEDAASSIGSTPADDGIAAPESSADEESAAAAPAPATTEEAEDEAPETRGDFASDAADAERALQAKWAAVTLRAGVTIGERLVMKLCVGLPEGVDPAMVRVRTVYNAQITGRTLDLDLSSARKEGAYYVVNAVAEALPFQMTAPVEITLFYDGSVMQALTYSFRDYLKQLGAMDASRAELCRAVLCWGGAAQRYFDGSYEVYIHDPADAGLTPVVPAMPKREAAYTGQIDGVGDYAFSAVFGAESSLKLFFRVSGDLNNLHFIGSGGHSVTQPVSEGDGIWSVRLTGIRAGELSNDFIITVSRGSQQVTLQCSPYYYAARHWDDSDPKLAALCRALVAYGDAVRSGS